MLLPGGAHIAPGGYDVGTHPGLRCWYFIQSCHAERSEASLCRSRQTLRFAQGDIARTSNALCQGRWNRDRPFAALRVTGCDWSHGQGLFFTIEPCLNNIWEPSYLTRRGLNEACYLCCAAMKAAYQRPLFLTMR